MTQKTTTVYLIEHQNYDDYELLGCYDTLEAAVKHADNPDFIQDNGNWRTPRGFCTSNITIREIGVRTKVHFSPIHQKLILPSSQAHPPTQ